MAGTFASMFFAYLFHLVMVRMLPETVYGDLALCVGFFMILQVPFNSVQTILGRDIAKLEAELPARKRAGVRRAVHVGSRTKHNKRPKAVDELYARYFRIGLAAGALTGVGLLLFLPLATRIFGESVRVGILALCIVMPPTYIVTVLRGYLQGREKIVPLSVNIALSPFGQFLASVILVSAGFGLFGAVSSIAIGFGLSIIVLPRLFWLGFRALKPSTGLNRKTGGLRLEKSFIMIVATNALLTIFLYMDLILVRALLSSSDAGQYNVAGITAKVLYFAVTGLVLALLPKSSKLRMGRDSRAIRRLLGISVLLLAPIIIFFAAFPRFVITLFYTDKYLPAVATFRILTISMSFFALFLILANILWSQNKEGLPLILSIITLIVDVGLLLWLVPKNGIEGAAMATLACSVLLFVPAAVSVALQLRDPRGGRANKVHPDTP